MGGMRNSIVAKYCSQVKAMLHIGGRTPAGEKAALPLQKIFVLIAIVILIIV